MKNSWMTRFITGSVFCAMVLAMFGISALVNVKADPTSTPAAKPAPKTAYVDFLELLKSYAPLQRSKFEIAHGLESAMMEMEERYADEIRTHERTRRESEPDHRNYRQAMRALIRLSQRVYQEQLLLENQAQADMRDAGIDAFLRLRTLVSDIAREMGYTQVLNIVRDPELAASAPQDFQVLQQQLLISPVLVYDTEHDITSVVLAKGEELWGTHISIKDDRIRCSHEGAALSLNGEGEYEVRLGQSVKFSVEVLQRGEPVDSESTEARVRWTRDGGFDLGTLNVSTGEFTAPEENPGRSTFRLVVRSQVDPTVSAEVQVRLLDAEGNPLASDE